MTSGNLLVFLTFVPSFVNGDFLQYALKGEKITFNTNLSPAPPDDILWKHKNNKVVHFNGVNEKDYDPFKSRLLLDWHTGNLEIRDLRLEDGGPYELDFFCNNKMQRMNFQLEVMDRVLKPSISCAINNGSKLSESEDEATLTCTEGSAQPHPSTKFTWISGGTEKTGNTLLISLRDGQDSEEYKCVVRNQLTNDSTSYIAKDCYPEEESAAGLIVGISFLVIFLLIALVLVLLFLWRKGVLSKSCGDDVEKQTHSSENQENGRCPEEESAHLLAREETMPSKQRLHQVVPEDSNQPEEKAPEAAEIQKSQDERHSSPQHLAVDPGLLSMCPPKEEGLPVENGLRQEEKVPESNPIHADRGTDSAPDSEEDRDERESSPSPSPETSRKKDSIENEPTEDPDLKVSGSDPSDFEKTDDPPSDPVERMSRKGSFPPPVPPKPGRGSEYRKKKEVAENDSSDPEAVLNGSPLEETSDSPDSEEKQDEQTSSPTPSLVSSQEEDSDENRLTQDPEAKVSESKGDAAPAAEKKLCSSPPPVHPKSRGASQMSKMIKASAELDLASENNSSTPQKTTDAPSDSEKRQDEPTPSPTPSPVNYQDEDSDENELTLDPEAHSSESNDDTAPEVEKVKDEPEEPQTGPESSLCFSAAPPASPLTQSSPETPQKEADVGADKDGSSDRVTGDSGESDSSEAERENEKNKQVAAATPSSTPEPEHVETSALEQSSRKSTDAQEKEDSVGSDQVKPVDEEKETDPPVDTLQQHPSPNTSEPDDSEYQTPLQSPESTIPDVKKKARSSGQPDSGRGEEEGGEE